LDFEEKKLENVAILRNPANVSPLKVEVGKHFELSFSTNLPEKPGKINMELGW